MGGNTFSKNMEPNVNLQGMLKSIKQNERKLNSKPYTRDFGTHIGRFRPRSRGISGSVSNKNIKQCQLYLNIYQFQLGFLLLLHRNYTLIKDIIYSAIPKTTICMNILR